MTGPSPRTENGADRLFGREGTLDVVRAFVQRAADQGATLLLTGEEGAGKSALLAAAEHRAAPSTTVLRAVGVELEEQLSFSGLHQLLVPLTPHLHFLCPAHRDALSVALWLEDGPAPRRSVLVEAVLALLRQTARERPVLLVVDDLQCIDRASTELLWHVARRTHGTRIGLLAALGPGSARPRLPAGIQVHHLEALDGQAAVELVRARFPAVESCVLDRIVTLAHGNPRALLTLPVDADTTPRETPQRPLVEQRALASVARWTVELSGVTRRFLLLAALEDSGDVDLLLDSVPTPDRGQVLKEAGRKFLNVDREARAVRFRDPALRSAVVELATSSERVTAHRALAELLTGRPERRLRHLVAGAPHPDEDISRTLDHEAMDRLRSGDVAGAVALLRRAVDLSPHTPSRVDRLARIAHLEVEVVGDLGAAHRLLAEARQLDPDADAVFPIVVVAAALLVHEDGDIDTAHRLLVEALEDRPHGPVGGPVDDALHLLLLVCIFGGRPELWRPFRRILERLGRWCPEVLQLGAGSPDEGHSGAAAGLDQDIAATEARDGALDPRHVVRVAATAVHLGRPEAHREDLWRLVRDGRSDRAVAPAIRALTVLALDAYHEGRWETAEELSREAITTSAAHGYALLALPARYYLALVAAARGDHVAVRELTDQLTGWGIPRGARRVAFYSAHARTLAALGRGDFENAYRESVALGQGPSSDADPGWVWSPILDRVEAAVRTHRSPEALAHVAAARAAAATSTAPHLSFLAAGGAALAAPETRADVLFEAALASPDVERWPFDLARLRLAHGEHLRRARATRAAREQLFRALRAFEDLGAQPWAARAGTELRAAGHDPERGAGEPHAKAALTAQEFEVAGLAASGMTSRQIADRLHISHRTVDAHLYRVFPKLNITGRAALRDALDRYRD